MSTASDVGLSVGYIHRLLTSIQVTGDSIQRHEQFEEARIHLLRLLIQHMIIIAEKLLGSADIAPKELLLEYASAQWQAIATFDWIPQTDASVLEDHEETVATQASVRSNMSDLPFDLAIPDLKSLCYCMFTCSSACACTGMRTDSPTPFPSDTLSSTGKSPDSFPRAMEMPNEQMFDLQLPSYQVSCCDLDFMEDSDKIEPLTTEQSPTVLDDFLPDESSCGLLSVVDLETTAALLASNPSDPALCLQRQQNYFLDTSSLELCQFCNSFLDESGLCNFCLHSLNDFQTSIDISYSDNHADSDTACRSADLGSRSAISPSPTGFADAGLATDAQVQENQVNQTNSFTAEDYGRTSFRRTRSRTREDDRTSQDSERIRLDQTRQRREANTPIEHSLGICRCAAECSCSVAPDRKWDALSEKLDIDCLLAANIPNPSEAFREPVSISKSHWWKSRLKSRRKLLI